MATLLPHIRIEPNVPAQISIIWLHGLGANGHDLEAVAQELRLPPDAPVRHVLPHAPARPVTVNAGHTTRAWFDVRSLDWLNAVDESELREAMEQIKVFIDYEQHQGVPAERIIVAGFSQGGMIALHTVARYPKPLAGIIALSACLPLHHRLLMEAHQANRNTPVFLAHGLYDPVISIDVARQSCTALRSIVSDVEWREYPIEHHVSSDEIIDIRRWLENLPAFKQ